MYALVYKILFLFFEEVRKHRNNVALLHVRILSKAGDKRS